MTEGSSAGASRAGAARIALALLVVLSAFFFVRWWDFVISPPFGPNYQAVFLVNGQAYFGEYRDRLGAYSKIDNVFYIQQAPQGDESVETRIIRRGSELHSPVASLLVPKSSVQFVEDLREDSSIAVFIRQALGR